MGTVDNLTDEERAALVARLASEGSRLASPSDARARRSIVRIDRTLRIEIWTVALPRAEAVAAA